MFLHNHDKIQIQSALAPYLDPSLFYSCLEFVDITDKQKWGFEKALSALARLHTPLTLLKEKINVVCRHNSLKCSSNIDIQITQCFLTCQAVAGCDVDSSFSS